MQADTPVGQAHEMITNANEALRQHLDGVQRREGLLSPDGVRAEIARFGNTEAARSLDTAEQLAADREAQAQTKVDQIRPDISPHDGDTATELRNQRCWDRERRRLDAQQGGKLVATARDALHRAEGTEIGVLAEEIGPYLARPWSMARSRGPS